MGMDFDFQKTYYRVLKNGAIPPRPTDLHEFDDLDRIGGRLSWGNQVQCLRIPEDAEVDYNQPIGQINEYVWHSDKVEVVGTLSFSELMEIMEEEGVVNHLVFNDYCFPDDFRLPQKLSGLTLTDCQFSKLKLPQEIDHLILGGLKLDGNCLFPEKVRYLKFDGCSIKNIQCPKTVNELSIAGSRLIENIVFPTKVDEGVFIMQSEVSQELLFPNCKKVSLSFSNFNKVKFPDQAEYIHAFRCFFFGKVQFPTKKPEDFRLKECAFENQEDIPAY